VACDVQEQRLAAAGDASWKLHYFMPSPADVAVTAFRSWVDKFASHPDSGLPKGASFVSREETFDRYSQHVVHCPSCQGVRMMQVE
jgi:hypothetical protein